MKRRTDRILEIIKSNNQNQENISVQSYLEKSYETNSILHSQSMVTKENVQPPTKEIINQTCADQELLNVITSDNQISSPCASTSVIEDSLDAFMPFCDPKMLYLPKAQNEGGIDTKIQEPLISSELLQKDSNKSRDSSSSSSSTSSSSGSNSSSNTHAEVPNISIPPSLTESDVDLSDFDPTYTVNDRQCKLKRSTGHSSTSSSSSSSVSPDRGDDVPGTIRQSRKRTRNPQNWKQNVAKELRNTGKGYVSLATKKQVPARSVKEACRCRLKCIENINDHTRNVLFEKYWSIGNVDLQIAFIRSCMLEVMPKYKYTNAVRPRRPNNAFFFTVNEIRIRVCKPFFINTLGICDRVIRTVKKKTDPQEFVAKDNRGKNVSRKPIDPALIQSIKDHINSIPKIESHYLRASTSREYISGEKTITDLWKDFDKEQKAKAKPTCDYWLYYDIFTKEFNLAFFQPKKDLCDLCLDFKTATNERKNDIKEKYDTHIQEKNLCRKEKLRDRQNISDLNICAVYDLQAVMQCPAGQSSSFFYKSKLNCFNLTIVEMLKKTEQQKKRKISNKENEHEIGAYGNVYCYFWDESQGKRGANEIGSCLYDYLKRLNEQNPDKNLHITFYSDNCCGQNKNKFITSLYSYAVHVFENIHTITHKYLIKGHTHNEGDNVHRLIEKEIKKNMKAGSIYTPYQYVTLIKNARKNGKPFNVIELTYDFFLDLKDFQEKWGYNYNEDETKNNFRLTDVKVLKIFKQEQYLFYFKISYEQEEYTSVNMRNKRKKMPTSDKISLVKAFSQRLPLPENKKKDLRELIDKNLIPHYYTDFYRNIL